jgi:tetratricopeptide (TPR) repeat protein
LADPGATLRRVLARWPVLLSILLAGSLVPAMAFPGGSRAAQETEAELEAWLLEARQDAERLRRSGAVQEARAALAELLSDEPGDWRTRACLAALEFDLSRFEPALEAARRVSREAEAAGEPGAAEARGAWRVELETLLELGRYGEGSERFEALSQAGLEPESSAALAELGARLCLGAGRRERASALREQARAASPAAEPPFPGGRPLEALWRSRSLRAAGELGPASNALVAELRSGEPEADLLAELASLYFEADGEVDDPRTQDRNPGPLLRKALELNPGSETALIGLYELHRFNWRRQSQTADSYLKQLGERRPRSVALRLAAARAAISLSQQDRARELLAELEREAGGRREVQALLATLDWIERGPEAAAARLAPLEALDPADGSLRRELGGLLLELYRFAEARPVLEAAVGRDPGDHRAWTLLGKAAANCGDIPAAREALERARIEARLRRDAERNNLSLVLEHIGERFVEFEAAPLTFAWIPSGSQVLELYWPPFYEAARRELVERYGFDPGAVRIEVFERHADFSVRSTGFEGFPALGVCFGPVVTAVSPQSELRGTFSWARTAFHEFTHVIHLGLSHNRCPRWITEGLATWEEVRRRPAWTRNMRRDLLDARANQEVFPLRELNGAFRGPRIVFGYYQGGLLCELLIEDFGFPSMLRLLEAFDRGADLDQAMREVFDLTPEQIDVRFLEFVDRQIAGLAVEPNWNPERAAWLRLGLEETPPEAAAEQAPWAESWCTLAWSAFQQGKRVDAEAALRVLSEAGLEPLRAQALRGHLALASRDLELASQRFGRFFEAGGEDFFARLALAEREFKAGREERAQEHLERAEAAFPGFPQAELSAELAQARLHQAAGRSEPALAAKARWLDWNADALAVRLDVARALVASGRHDEAAQRFEEAIEIDPFLRALHIDFGRCLLELGRWSEARREFLAAQRVPAELDGDELGPLEGALLAELAALEGQALLGLGQPEEAEAQLARALAADPGAAEAKRLRAALEAAR